VPASLFARDLKVTIGRTVVLDGVSVTLSPGTRAGLVGPNGVGKSTLLRALAGRVRPERGTVELQPRRATVGLLDQEPERRTGETVRAALRRRTGVAQADAELEAATAALADGAAGAADSYDAALHRWLALGSADFDARAGELRATLRLGDDLLEQEMTTLSGGQAAKVSLAGLLLSRFDVLLLDEPTNDLDLDGLARLEEFVLGHEGPMAIVSHDRVFLERTVTEVVELDEHTRAATTFAGGWLAYLAERETARRHAEEAYGSYVTKRAELSARARREREWAVKGITRIRRKPKDNDRALRGVMIESTEQLAARASRTERALERLDVIDKPWEPWQLRFEIAAAGRSGDLVALLDDAIVDLGAFRLGPVDLEVAWAERVAIVGPNGSGKTTLLRALLGQVPLSSGLQRLGSSVVIGGVEQARRQLTDAPTLLDAVQRETGSTVAAARSLLAKFGLGPTEVGRPTRSLSPGERTRATLALLQARGVNCLVLDEPTNHLDLPAIEQLEAAVAAFGGTVLLVSHDRRFLDAVRPERIVELRDGRVIADRAT
jgi:ATPase subunit of ABC transporter with duplicated ATPase domains